MRGAAGNGRVNLIDTRDVAKAARVALLDITDIDSQTAYQLEGPATVSMMEIADELSLLLGKTIVYQHRPPENHREVLIDSGGRELTADVLLGIDQLFRGSVLAETTNTETDLTGKALRSVSAWLRARISLRSITGDIEQTALSARCRPGTPPSVLGNVYVQRRLDLRP